jgi:hypothetical protein
VVPVAQPALLAVAVVHSAPAAPAQKPRTCCESRRRVEAASGRNQRYWIEEIDTTGLWQPPPQPKPRDRYAVRVTTTTPPGKWATVHVDVLDGETVIAGYDRNYSMLQTFEPFRQGTATSR